MDFLKDFGGLIAWLVGSLVAGLAGFFQVKGQIRVLKQRVGTIETDMREMSARHDKQRDDDRADAKRTEDRIMNALVRLEGKIDSLTSR